MELNMSTYEYLCNLAYVMLDTCQCKRLVSKYPQGSAVPRWAQVRIKEITELTYKQFLHVLEVTF